MNREEITRRLKQRLELLQADIGKLEVQLRHASDDARAQVEFQLQKAREATDEVRVAITDVQTAAEGRLQEIREQADKAWETVKGNIDRLKEKLGL
jgi:predicted  nucleic acid-binding Zn-ribbon protein